jgi:hypothetical protein
MASFVLASVWQAATARTRLPQDRRRDASVYVDEAHNVLNLAGSVADMLAEARGYRLSLVLAHQDLAQFPRDTVLAISANARNKIYFACSPEDARQLARHTLPELDEHDLAHLDAYTAAGRLVIDGRLTPAFSLQSTPLPTPLGHTAQLREAIRRPLPPSPPPVSEAPAASTGDGDGGDQAASGRSPRGSSRRTSRRSPRTDHPNDHPDTPTNPGQRPAGDPDRGPDRPPGSPHRGPSRWSAPTPSSASSPA